MTEQDMIIQDLRRECNFLEKEIDELNKQIHEYQKRLLAYEGKPKGENNGRA